MGLATWKEIAEIAKNVGTTIAAFVGGGWAFWRFILQREGHARIEFDIELNILGPQADKILVEPVAVVTNRGAVRHWLKGFQFDIRCFTETSKVIEGDERINHQILFEPVAKKRYWIPPDWIASFIDPGVTQRFRYVTAVPNNATFILIYAKFQYPDAESEFHTAQRVFRVPDPTVAVR